MAIVIQCNLHPHGWGAEPQDIATITIHTTDDMRHHAFGVSLAGSGKRIRLVRPKSMSAHRNILHVLRDFLVDADLDALGQDYVTTAVDRPAQPRDDILRCVANDGRTHKEIRDGKKPKRPVPQ